MSEEDKKLSKAMIRKAELNKLYELWNGKEAQLVESKSSGLNYVVLVDRYVRPKVHQRSEYLFSSYQVAYDCYRYWSIRGGLVSLMLAKVLAEEGYTSEPNLHGGP